MSAAFGFYENPARRAREQDGLNDHDIYILDGGFATSAARYLDDPEKDIDQNPLWASGLTHTHPDIVTAVHKDFLNAGATIITTNTYQCSIDLFAKHLKLPDPALDSARLFSKACKYADKAVEEVFDCPGFVKIAGSIGPYGACLGDGSEYSGSYIDSVSREELTSWHFERIKRLTLSGVDFFAVETIPSVVEALAIMDVLMKFPGTKCWISFQCRDEAHTARGEKFDEALKALFLHLGYSIGKLIAVGVNCVPPKNVTPLLKLANTVNNWRVWQDSLVFKRLPYVVYPNSGEAWNNDRKCFEGSPQETEFLNEIPTWLSLGAKVIGGCCRVGPETVKKIRERVGEALVKDLHTESEVASDDSEESWESIKAKLRKKPREKRDKDKKKEDGTVEKEPEDFGPFFAVPGLVSKEEALRQYRAFCEYLDIECSISDDENKEDESEDI